MKWSTPEYMKPVEDCPSRPVRRPRYSLRQDWNSNSVEPTESLNGTKSSNQEAINENGGHNGSPRDNVAGQDHSLSPDHTQSKVHTTPVTLHSLPACGLRDHMSPLEHISPPSHTAPISPTHPPDHSPSTQKKPCRITPTLIRPVRPRQSRQSCLRLGPRREPLWQPRPAGGLPIEGVQAGMEGYSSAEESGCELAGSGITKPTDQDVVKARPVKKNVYFGSRARRLYRDICSEFKRLKGLYDAGINIIPLDDIVVNFDGSEFGDIYDYEPSADGTWFQDPSGEWQEAPVDGGQPDTGGKTTTTDSEDQGTGDKAASGGQAASGQDKGGKGGSSDEPDPNGEDYSNGSNKNNSKDSGDSDEDDQEDDEDEGYFEPGKATKDSGFYWEASYQESVETALLKAQEDVSRHNAEIIECRRIIKVHEDRMRSLEVQAAHSDGIAKGYAEYSREYREYVAKKKREEEKRERRAQKMRKRKPHKD